MNASRHIRVPAPFPTPKLPKLVPKKVEMPAQLVEQMIPHPEPKKVAAPTPPPKDVPSVPPPSVKVTLPPPTPTVAPLPPLTLPSKRSVIPRQLSRQILGKPTDPTNTHTYDGAFKEDFQSSLKVLEGSTDEKSAIFAFLRALVALVDGDAEALKNLNLIIDAFYKGTMDNYDPTSEADASDVLFSIGQPLKTLTKELVCQLGDMSTGACPQGRVNRLAAVLRMLRDPSFYAAI